MNGIIYIHLYCDNKKNTMENLNFKVKIADQYQKSCLHHKVEDYCLLPVWVKKDNERLCPDLLAKLNDYVLGLLRSDERLTGYCVTEGDGYYKVYARFPVDAVMNVSDKGDKNYYEISNFDNSVFPLESSLGFENYILKEEWEKVNIL